MFGVWCLVFGVRCLVLGVYLGPWEVLAELGQNRRREKWHLLSAFQVQRFEIQVPDVGFGCRVSGFGAWVSSFGWVQRIFHGEYLGFFGFLWGSSGLFGFLWVSLGCFGCRVPEFGFMGERKAGPACLRRDGSRRWRSSSGSRVQHLLYRNVQRFRGGLVCKAHRLLYLVKSGTSVSSTGWQ